MRNPSSNHPLNRRTLFKYITVQLPGLLVAALLLYFFRNLIGYPPSLIFWIMLVLVTKDILLYPVVWRSYATGTVDEGLSLIGKEALVIQALAPSGRVKLNGVIWKARPEKNSESIPKGTRVIVTAREDLTLIVRLREINKKTDDFDK